MTDLQNKDSGGVDYEKVAARLLQVRKSLKLGQREIAKMIGISKPYWSALERGERTPSAFVMNVLKSKLDISTNWLLFGEGLPSEKDFRINDAVGQGEIDEKFLELKWIYNKVDLLLDILEKEFGTDLDSLTLYSESLVNAVALMEVRATNAKNNIISTHSLARAMSDLIERFRKDFDSLLGQYHTAILHPRKRKKFEAPKDVASWDFPLK